MRMSRLNQVKAAIYVAIAVGGAIMAGMSQGFVTNAQAFWVGVAVIGLTALQAKLSKGAEEKE